MGKATTPVDPIRITTQRFLQWEGVEHSLDGYSLIATMSSILKPGIKLTDQQLGLFYGRTGKLIDELSGNSPNVIGSYKSIPSHKKSRMPSVAFKYVSEANYETYIRKGKIRLGSINLYRKAENTGVRDQREGFSLINFNGGAQEVQSYILAGFEQAIFCMTLSSDYDERLANEFGSRLLKISDLSGFVAAVKCHIGSQNVIGDRIHYNDYKIVRQAVKLPDYDFHRLRLSEEWTDFIFSAFRKAAFFPSIFVKPQSYEYQNEFRLAFERAPNFSGIVDIDDPDLARFFEVIG